MNAENVIPASLLIPMLLSGSYVLYLSFFKISINDIINLYTINVFVPMQLFTLSLIGSEIELYLGFYGIKSIIHRHFTSFFGAVSSISFRVLSDALLLSIYVAYKHPLSYARYFSARRWKWYFATLHVIAILCGVCHVIVMNTGGAISWIEPLPSFFVTFTVTAIITALVSTRFVA
ncbi:unnamed protein product [Anisakis simplex]|uniref:Serpentine receptor class gamma n=1 Tax=Anisakis simplex TaxID=6269 RepID=A0A0M3JYU6_ANISI|nr:unnamed protein product [Anisakis simplex]